MSKGSSMSASSSFFPFPFPRPPRFFRFFIGGDSGPGLFGGGVDWFPRFGCTRVGVAGGDCGPGSTGDFGAAVGSAAFLLGDDFGVAVGDVPAADLVVIGDMVS